MHSMLIRLRRLLVCRHMLYEYVDVLTLRHAMRALSVEMPHEWKIECFPLGELYIQCCLLFEHITGNA